MATITIEALKSDFEAGIITAVKCDGYTRFTCSISGARWAVVKLANSTYKIAYEVLGGDVWSYAELAKALALEAPTKYDSLVKALEPILLKLEEKIGKVTGVIYENNSVVIQSVNQYENRDKYRDARQFLDSIGVNSWCSGMNNLMICL